MRIQPCYYCSANVYPGHGIMFVRNDARSFVFCGHKCKTHFKRKHHPRKSKWTKTHRKLAGKEMAVDSVLDFEKKRNTPVKYDRDLYIKTIQAMQTIERIKEKRKLRFYLARMRQAQLRHMPNMQKDLHKHGHLVEAAKTAHRLMLARQKARLIREGPKKKAALASQLVL